MSASSSVSWDRQPGLLERLKALAATPVLLVATDFDGTLAPIVPDPMDARPTREGVVAIRTLAELGQTHVAVVSGRALRDLAFLTRLPDEIRLVGSHGGEFDLGFARALSPERAETLAEVRRLARAFGAQWPGIGVETKPASVAIHYRNRPDHAHQVEAFARELAERFGLSRRDGKMVAEVAVVETSKGFALDRLRSQVGATALLYLGDDVTDEDAFHTLTGPDVGVKVGPEASAAEFHISDAVEVSRVLAFVAEQRRSWLEGARERPIEHHSLLSDQRGLALVSDEARVVWACFPRPDSPALFAELLGGSTAGGFGITPVGDGSRPTQRYIGSSLVLESRWPTMTLVDYLDASGGRPNQRPGRCELVRVVTGSGECQIDFSPRIDFGRVVTAIEKRSDGLIVRGSHSPIVLRSPGVRWEIVDDGRHQSARGVAPLSDVPLEIELRYGTGSLAPDRSESIRVSATTRFWANWLEHLDLPDRARPLLEISAMVLEGLRYGPTGAFLAAATTSLPEHLGGIRNWDYRFCWLRDGALVATTMVRVGRESEGIEFLNWVLYVLETVGDPARLSPLYTVTGEPPMSEAEIAELSGYRRSRPVRVGNAADSQVQLDVFGPIVNLAYELAKQSAPLSSDHWQLVCNMVDAVEARWREPDHGIWELRARPRHHVHSKTMCWMTVNKAIEVGDLLMGEHPLEWETLADTIRDDVLANGVDPERGIFTAAYGADDLDAASLWVGLSGMVAPDDPRFVRTVDAVDQALGAGPVTWRYRHDDGLPGVEGAFLICGSWMIDSLYLIGRVAEAERRFDRLCALAGPTGMMSEQYDPDEDVALGNVPQAYSHLGLIDNALRLAGRLSPH